MRALGRGAGGRVCGEGRECWLRDQPHTSKPRSLFAGKSAQPSRPRRAPAAAAQPISPSLSPYLTFLPISASPWTPNTPPSRSVPLLPSPSPPSQLTCPPPHTPPQALHASPSSSAFRPLLAPELMGPLATLTLPIAFASAFYFTTSVPPSPLLSQDAPLTFPPLRAAASRSSPSKRPSQGRPRASLPASASSLCSTLLACTSELLRRVLPLAGRAVGWAVGRLACSAASRPVGTRAGSADDGRGPRPPRRGDEGPEEGRLEIPPPACNAG